MVPDSGPANSVAGELVRALARIGYRFYNLGEVFYEGEGLTTVAPCLQFVFNFLESNADTGTLENIKERVANQMSAVDAIEEEDNYGDLLLELVETVTDILSRDTSKQFFIENNTANSTQTNADWFNYNQRLYTTEIPLDLEAQEEFKQGTVDPETIIDCVVEALRGFLKDEDVQNIHICISKDGTKLYAEQLTKKARSILESKMEDGSLQECIHESLNTPAKALRESLNNDYYSKCREVREQYIDYYKKFHGDENPESIITEDFSTDALDDDAARQCCFKYNCGRRQLVEMIKDGIK